MSDKNKKIRMVECSVGMESDIWSSAYDAMTYRRARVGELLNELRSDVVRSDKSLEKGVRDSIRHSIKDYTKARRVIEWVTNLPETCYMNPKTREVI